MDILSIIEKKKNNQALSKKELDFFVRGVTDGSIPDYQTAALLMAIRLCGMNEDETFALTVAMLESGEQLDLNALEPTVDKHSTGGVSDSTTFITVPLLALMGFRVAKMSGRGLGFTGGTIDKLECFDGYRAEQTEEDFFRIVKTTGASIVSAGRTLAPADKILYALRDVTGTVDSLPLIASSVMCKKLASGAQTIVLDVKYGNGAFMRDIDSAVELACLMVKIGRKAGRKVGALVTSMEEPLGEYVGGNLECKGAIEVLRGKRNALYTVARALVLRACELYGFSCEPKDIDALIDSGKAYAKFAEIISAHGGTVPEQWVTAPIETTITAQKSGYVTAIHTKNIGEVNLGIGGGRKTKDAQIDHTVGIRLHQRVGDAVNAGDALATMFTKEKNQEAAKILSACFEIGSQSAISILIAEYI